MAKTKIVSMNFGGNLHDVARYVTEFGLSDHFVQAQNVGMNSIVLFRLPKDWPTDNYGPIREADYLKQKASKK